MRTPLQLGFGDLHGLAHYPRDPARIMPGPSSLSEETPLHEEAENHLRGHWEAPEMEMVSSDFCFFSCQSSVQNYIVPARMKDGKELN